MLNQNSLYYSENPYRWESMRESENENDSSLADNLLETFYESLYTEEIQEWDWQGIKQDALTQPQESFEGDSYGSSFLGTVFSLMPSGKYWTFYADSNVDRLESIQDSAFNAALESVAESYDMWIESGEGDPCDLYACIGIESNEIEE